MCLKHPGFNTDLLIESDLRRFVEVWRGFRDVETEMYTGHLKLSGPAGLKRIFPRILKLHPMAGQARKRVGAERALWRTDAPGHI